MANVNDIADVNIADAFAMCLHLPNVNDIADIADAFAMCLHLPNVNDIADVNAYESCTWQM